MSSALPFFRPSPVLLNRFGLTDYPLLANTYMSHTSRGAVVTVTFGLLGISVYEYPDDDTFLTETDDDHFIRMAHFPIKNEKDVSFLLSRVF